MQQQNKYHIVKNLMKSAGHHSNRGTMNLKHVREESKEYGTQNEDTGE